MNFVAWQMLTGDRAKYAGLVLAIAFSTFLMSHQMSIFVGLLNRAQSQIIDIADAEIWVMDPKTEYLDEVRALSSQDLYRVRGVEGIQWEVPLFKGNARAKASDGQFHNTTSFWIRRYHAGRLAQDLSCRRLARLAIRGLCGD